MLDSRQIIIIIIKPQMTEKSHIGIRQRYVEFRFEESLRRYQQPPRKLVKLNDSICKNCCRKSCESGRQNRLIRFCQTRRFYHAASRQKASEYSHKKKAKQQSSGKQSGHVSDFNCNENDPASHHKEKSNKYQIQYEITLDDNQLDKKLIRFDKPINWSIQIKQTPIKQSIRQQLKHICSSQKSGISQQKQQTDMNSFKVKDIDFHIGLVEQLHQKIIDQYMKFQMQPMELSMRSQQQIKPQMNDNNHQEYDCIEGDVQLIQSEMNDQNQQFLKQKNEKEAQQQKIDQQFNHPIQNSMQNDREDHNQLQKTHSLPKTQQTNQNIPQVIYQKQKQITGRIQIKGQKGSCYLSIRILNKLLNSNISPNRVTSTLIRHHPYLGDASHILQMITEKNMAD